jgi:hypothetical protein
LSSLFISSSGLGENLTEDLNIEIHYIPAGATDVLQPLDRLVFGVLNSQARKLFHRRVNEDHLHRRTKYEACEDLMTHLSQEVLLTSWNIYNEDRWDEEDL